MERAHIAIFGRCNAGKSTLLNLLTGAPVAVVSPQAGTTTDLVRKNSEVLGVGPVTFIDTAGWDDTSTLGPQRIARTREAMQQADLALLVFREWGAPEEELLSELSKVGLPVVTVYNETDNDPARIFEAIKNALPQREKPSMFGGSVGAGDTVLLVAPVDGAAPEGRLILPQVQAIRELLDSQAVTVVVQPEQLAGALKTITPKLIVTDSQVLREVRATAPEDMEITTFSILLAAAKGDRVLYEQGLAAADTLKDGDRVLIAESCTHQTSCDDIGRVKIPRWLEEYTGARLEFTVLPGLAPLPDDLADYALAVQCGGCMVTRTQLLRRIRTIAAAGVPVTNYGMLINKIRR
jgi:small GTP-binding protein